MQNLIQSLQKAREEQPFLTALQLAKLLTEHPTYTQLPIFIHTPFGNSHIDFKIKGYYLNQDKSIYLYGEDKMGIPLSMFWNNIMVKDLYGRYRSFLEKEGNRYRPRITPKPEGEISASGPILMPVSFYNIQVGDLYFDQEGLYEMAQVIQTEDLKDGRLRVHHLNRFGIELVTYAKEDMIENYYTLIDPYRKG